MDYVSEVSVYCESRGKREIGWGSRPVLKDRRDESATWAWWIASREDQPSLESRVSIGAISRPVTMNATGVASLRVRGYSHMPWTTAPMRKLDSDLGTEEVPLVVLRDSVGSRLGVIVFLR